MIRKLRVTVDGVTYDVAVEIPDDAAAGLPAAPPPVLPAAPVIAPAVSAPVSAAPPPAPSAAPAGPASPGDVPSPLTGRVTAVIVTAGQDVKEGDHLLTLEAMKMNT